MEHLAVELLSQIIKNCDHESLLNLRSTSRSLREVITPMVFEHIYIGFRPRHIQYLAEIADSPLTQHVRHLTVDTEILPSFCLDTWGEAVKDTIENRTLEAKSNESLQVEGIEIPEDIRRRVRGAEEFDAPTLLELIYPRGTLAEAWRRVKDLSRPQRIWHRSEYPELLQHALIMLESLVRVDLIDPRGMIWQNEWALHANKRPIPDALTACSPWKGTLIDPGIYYHGLTDTWNCEERQPSEEHFNSSYPVWLMCRALSSRPGYKRAKPISAFNIDVGHHESLLKVYIELTKFRGKRPSESAWSFALRDLFGFFGGLTHLSISATAPQFGHARSIREEWFRGLQQAKNLRSLTLNFGDEGPIIWGDLLDSLTESPWPPLEQLRLSGLINPSALLTLVRMSAKHLRRMELLDARMLRSTLQGPDERWDDLFEQLQPALQLKEAYVRRLRFESNQPTVTFFDPRLQQASEVNRQVEGYLTRQTTELPR